MKILQIYLNNNLRNFNYIVYSEKTNEAIFFDPMDISKTLPLCKDLNLIPRYLINTHDHYDHIMNNEEFLKLISTQEVRLAHGESFKLSATEEVRSVFTPGHVKQHYCYHLIENSKLIGIISGDTVFNAGVGNCKDGGDPELLFETIRDHFYTLEDDVIIYPSHDYFLSNLKFAKTVDPNNMNIDKYIEKRSSMNLDKDFLLTSIGEEKLFNPFFRVFNNAFSNKQDKKDLFIDIRSKRDSW
jgi:hydroxyacylglutathione hydrolase